MPDNEKSIVAGHRKKFLQDCVDSDLSPDGAYVMGYSSEGLFKIFGFDGTLIAEDKFKDVSNCYFTKASKLAVVTHGAGKETSVTVFNLKVKGKGSTSIEKLHLEIGFMKSGKRYVVSAEKDRFLAIQKTPSSVDVYDTTDGFKSLGMMDIVPSVEVGSVSSSVEPLIYASNANTTKQNEKGTLLEVYDLSTKTSYFSHFFSGIQQVDVFPCPKSALLLVRGHKYVDTSGQSYYGKNTLDLIDLVTKKKRKIICYNGPIYNLAWNPRGDTFAVCAGMMPSHTVLYYKTGEPFLVVLKDPKNSVYWSPNGDFIAVAGFGNLNGEIQIWDVSKKTLLGKCQHSDAGDLEWAPDGRRFVTKVEFRFLREGNQYRVAED